MRCPHCGSIADVVLDSRPRKDFAETRRRRKCLQCKGRFTTIERTIGKCTPNTMRIIGTLATVREHTNRWLGEIIGELKED